MKRFLVFTAISTFFALAFSLWTSAQRWPAIRSELARRGWLTEPSSAPADVTFETPAEVEEATA